MRVHLQQPSGVLRAATPENDVLLVSEGRKVSSLLSGSLSDDRIKNASGAPLEARPQGNPLRGDTSTYRRGVNISPLTAMNFVINETSFEDGKKFKLARHYILNHPLRFLALPQFPSCKPHEKS